MTKDTHEKKGSSAKVAGAAGVLAGAALGAAAAVALTDKKTRKKVMDKVDSLKEQALKKANDLRGEAKAVKETAADKLKAAEKEIQKS